jgi:hypothetical protein
MTIEPHEITREAARDERDPTRAVFRVKGPYGTVTYRPLDNRLHLEPRFDHPSRAADGHADEALAYYMAQSDTALWELLERWHDSFPTEMKQPELPGEWDHLRGDDLVAAMRAATWYAVPDDTIGGWCVMPIDLPRSSGVPAVGDFLSEGLAKDIAADHNAKLTGGTR